MEQPDRYNHFVSFKLTEAERDYAWKPSIVEANLRATNPAMKPDPLRHTLHLTQAILDDSAEEGELNLIQISTSDVDGRPLMAPLAYLKSGTQYQVRLDIELPDAQVIIKLTKGKGPIHVMGLHTMSTSDDWDEGSEAEEDGEEEQEEAGDEQEEAAVNSDNEIEMKETDAEAEAVDLKHSPAEADGDGEKTDTITPPTPVSDAVDNEKKRKMDSDEGGNGIDGDKDEPKADGTAGGTNAANGNAAAKKPKLIEADVAPATDEGKPETAVVVVSA